MNKLILPNYITAALLIALFSTGIVVAQDARSLDLDAIFRGSEYYDPFGDSSCSASFGTGDFTKVSPEILARISQNEDVYRAASRETGVPWEMIATLHYRESSGKVENPSPMSTGALAGVGQGVYQLYSWLKDGVIPRDSFSNIGPIDNAEFLRQSILAAEFLRDDKDAARRNSGVTKNTPLSSTSPDPDVVKELFFYYNGASSIYVEQAVRIGKINPWEGSPYVMNFASPLQSPDNFDDWRQVRTDEGPAIRANGEPGAWLVYSAIAGQTCDNPEGSSILEIAQAELTKGVREEPSGTYGADILKYTNQNPNIPWGPAFVSWVYNQSGKALEAGAPGNWLIPSGEAMLDSFTVNDAFFTIDQDVPQPGDVLFTSPPTPDPLNRQVNVYIVDRVEGNSVWVIGGDVGDAVVERQITGFAQSNEVLGFGSQNIGGDIDENQLPIGAVDEN